MNALALQGHAHNYKHLPRPVICLVLALLFFVAPYAAHGADEGAAKSSGSSGKILWFGLDGGPLYSESLNESNEISKAGYSFGLKTNFSYITEIANFEIGAAWLHTVLDVPEEKTEPVLLEDGTEELPPGIRTTQVKTRLGVGNFSIRFSLIEDVLEVGPTASIYFGTDTSFSPIEGETTKNPNVMVGANAAIILKKPSGKSLSAVRLFAQYLHDITIENRDVQLINVGLDFGFGFAKEKPKIIIKEKIRTRTRTKTLIKYKTKIQRETKVVSTVKETYLVDAGVVNFETAKHDIYSNVRYYLRDLALFLRTRERDWDMIILKSHTDYRGGAAYNEGLSRRRANAVESILMSNGITRARLMVESNSYREPVDRSKSSVSLAKNRRVEIFVRGGANTPALKQEIFRLQQLHRMPSTCRSNNCQ